MCCCFPSICKFFHLWSCANCCYDSDCPCLVDYGGEDWVRRYTEEEREGVKLLQRERRLKEQANEDASAAPPQYDKIQDTPAESSSAATSSSSPVERETTETRKKYLLHLEKLRKLDSRKPNCPKVDQWEMNRRVKNRQGMSLAWEEESQQCARLGGCCGRGCNCCRQPLREYMLPGDTRGKKSAIYGHCTVDCGCCIRDRGFYKPDTDKPDSGNLGS
ncbi:hypothetical protein FQN54_001245 [Arachnomyces sp. PD_36]|nr:hypothetical protein FQN54_001245 [Arachnomyces sp. PD_36]